MKRIERQGVDDTGNRIGRALTGRPSGLPVCRRPVEGVSPGIHCCITPLHIRSMRLSLPQGGWQFRRAVACMTWGQHLDTRTRIIDSNHGHERPVRELRVLLWDILCVLVDISTRTPYCSTVCLCLNNSLTLTVTGRMRLACAATARRHHILSPQVSCLSLKFYVSAASFTLFSTTRRHRTVRTRRW